MSGWKEVEARRRLDEANRVYTMLLQQGRDESKRRASLSKAEVEGRDGTSQRLREWDRGVKRVGREWDRGVKRVAREARGASPATRASPARGTSPATRASPARDWTLGFRF